MMLPIVPNLLPRVFALVLLLMLFPAGLVMLHIRHGTRPVSACHMLAAVSGMGVLFMLFCHVASLDPTRKEDFLLGARLMAAIFILSVMVLVVRYWIGRRRGRPSAEPVPDLRAVYRHADDLILQLDRDGRILDMNRPSACMALMGAPVTHLAEMASRCTPESQGGPGISEGCQHLSEAWQCETAVGARSFLVMHTPVEGRNGVAFGSVMVFHDITEDKENERMLGRRNEALAEANRKLGNLVKMVGMLQAEQTKAEMLRLVQLEVTDRMDGILSDIRALRATDCEDPDASRRALGGIVTSLRGVYRDVRRTIQRIGRDATATENMAAEDTAAVDTEG